MSRFTREEVERKRIKEVVLWLSERLPIYSEIVKQAVQARDERIDTLLNENEKLNGWIAFYEENGRELTIASEQKQIIQRQAAVVKAARRITEFNGIGIGGSALSPQEVRLLNNLRKALAKHDGVSHE